MSYFFAGFVMSLAADPSNPGIVYAGTYNGVYKTTNGGATWKVMNSGLTTINSTKLVAALAIDPTASSTVYAGLAGDGVYRSTNGGVSWSAVNTGLNDQNTSRNVRVLAIDPSDSN